MFNLLCTKQNFEFSIVKCAALPELARCLSEQRHLPCSLRAWVRAPGSTRWKDRADTHTHARPRMYTPTHMHTHTHAHPHMYTPTRELSSHMWLKTAIPIVLSSGELFWCDSLLPLTNKTPKDKDWTEYHWCVPNIWHSRISVCQFIDHVWLKGKFGGLIFYFVVFVLWFLLAQGGQRNVLSILLKRACHWELL